MSSTRAKSIHHLPGLPLAVKIAPPRVPATQTPRGRLLTILDSAPDDAVVLISAPAGSGKTQLLAQWATTRPDPTAWVTLDPADNDERNLWSALDSALRRCGPPTDDPPPQQPGRRVSSVPASTGLATLAEAIRLRPVPLTVILDDVQELTSPASLQLLGTLIAHHPDHLRLVLSGRSDPDLRLARLRLEERLLELRAPDLAFTIHEAELLIGRSGLTLTPGQVATLTEQTGGWAAGLRLAATAMQRSDPAVVLADLIGTTGTISDYLVGEVMAGLSTETRTVLDCIAVCSQVTAAMARHLTGTDDAGAMLAELESANSLVVAFGRERRWFRLRPLLRAHLLADIHRLRPEVEPLYHRRAVAWFDEHGQPDHALHHAIQLADPAVAGPILTRQGFRLLVTGHHALLRAAAEAFPTVIASDPRLTLTAAAAYLEVGDAATARRHVHHAVDLWPATPDPDLLWLSSLVDLRFGLFGEGAEQVPLRAVVTGTPSDDSLSLLTKATEAVAAGRLAESRELSVALVDVAGHSGNGYLVAHGVTLLTVAAALGGDLASVPEISARVTTAVDPQLWQGTTGDTLLHILQAQAALAAGQPAQCLEQLAQLEVGQQPASPTALAPFRDWIGVLVATADVDLGRVADGLDQLAALRTGLDLERTPPELRGAMATVEHDAALQAGRAEQARDVLTWAMAAIPRSAELRYLRARRAARISRFRHARTEIEPVLDGTLTPLNQSTVINAWLVETWIRIRLGERTRAISSLASAMAAAQEQATMRPLLRAPVEVVNLLGDHLGAWGGHDDIARTVLAGRLHTAAPIVPLTHREQQVLGQLPSMRSLEEISGDLSVSLNTVKTHVRSIYGKLGASSRREAVQTARREGLL